MIVVADTSPLNYLLLIHQIHVLESLYGTIAIPPAVHEELLRAGAPAVVRAWASSLPSWVQVRAASVDPELEAKALDDGERQAIALALTLGAPALVIDESAGRSAARERGLRVIGTLGILREADALGMLDLREAIEHLRKTNFRIAAATLRHLLPPE